MVLASRLHDVHGLFTQVRKLSPKKPKRRSMLRDADGHLLDPECEGERLFQHFRGIFHDDKALDFVIPLCQQVPFGLGELTTNLLRLPWRKSVPEHCVPSYVWKGLTFLISPWLMESMATDWSRTTPHIIALWRSAWLALLPKAGKSGNDPQHWRPIGLQESLGKAALKCITQVARDSVLQELVCWPQYAYLPGRGTADALGKVLHQLLHNSRSTIHSKRAGQHRTDCVGGMQILIDLQGAFDKAPRTLLQKALIDLPFISLLLAWHELTPCHLNHGSKDYVIEGNIGVRQGCVSAPFLWVAFVRLWHKSLADKLGYKWVLEHVTTYADDNHISWCFRDPDDVHTSMSEARVVLDSFPAFSMKISKDKTVCIFRISGRSAHKIRKQYIRRGSGRTMLSLRRSNPQVERLDIPMVDSHVYLGLKVSYSTYSQMSFRHRRKCGIGNFMCLRPWWTPSRLPLRARVHLWLTCVWPSLTYGLEESGLTPLICADFCSTIMRELRWLARSPSHITHETNSSLLCRLHLSDPLLMLAEKTIKHWYRKLCQSSMLDSMDVLHLRWKALSHKSYLVTWLWFCVLKLLGTDHLVEAVQMVKKNLPPDHEQVSQGLLT